MNVGYASTAYLEYCDTINLRTNVNAQAVKKVLDSVDMGLADMFEIARQYDMLNETWEKLIDLVSQHKSISAKIYEQVAAAERKGQSDSGLDEQSAKANADVKSHITANEKTTPKAKTMPKHGAESTHAQFERTGRVRSKPY